MHIRFIHFVTSINSPFLFTDEWFSISLLTSWRTSRMFPVFDIYEQSCYTHSCIVFCVNINLHLSQVNILPLFSDLHYFSWQICSYLIWYLCNMFFSHWFQDFSSFSFWFSLLRYVLGWLSLIIFFSVFIDLL